MSEDNKIYDREAKAPQKSRKSLLVIIPYLSSGAKGKELRLCVASWRRFFQGKCRFCIVTENPDAVKSDAVIMSKRDVRVLQSNQLDPIEGEYMPHINVYNSIRLALSYYPDETEFVMCDDDICAIAPFSYDDLRLRKTDGAIYDNVNDRNGYRSAKARTRLVLHAEGFEHVRSYSVHLPFLYEREKWLSVFEDYELDRKSYCIEDLYYHRYHYAEPTIMLTPNDDIRCWMSSAAHRPDEVHDAISRGRKKWVVCAENAYGWIIEDMLLRHVGIN